MTDEIQRLESEELTDEDLESLRQVLRRTSLSKKQISAYIDHRIHNKPSWYVAEDLNIKESTLESYVSACQSVVKDVIAAADVLMDIEDAGISLTETPTEIDKNTYKQTYTYLVKYNNTRLSHGEIEPQSYPSINDNIPAEYILKLGRGGTDRFPFDLRYFFKNEPARAAKLYASIIRKTYTTHKLADEYEEITEQLSRHFLSERDIEKTYSLHRAVSESIDSVSQPDAETASSEALPAGLNIDRELIQTISEGDPPEIYTEHGANWGGLFSSDKFTVESYDLFYTSTDRRPFVTSCIFASVIGHSLENPLNGPYQIVIQHGQWVFDMPELICRAVCEPPIEKIVLINELSGRSPAGTCTRFEEGVRYIKNHHPNRISVEKNGSSDSTRRYIELTDEKLKISGWEKEI